jgi:hypothetical protein
MAARLSALHACRFLPPGKFLVLISLRGWVNPKTIVWLEGLGKLKKFTSSGTRTSDLPACSSASTNYTTACPRQWIVSNIILMQWINHCYKKFCRLIWQANILDGICISVHLLVCMMLLILQDVTKLQTNSEHEFHILKRKISIFTCVQKHLIFWVIAEGIHL